MKVIREGYVYVKVFNHPFAHNGYISEHRLVVEKFIGRYLTPQESIHHINRNKEDNRIENLFLFPNHNQHRKFENKVRQFGFTNPILKQIKDRWKPYLAPIITG